MDEFLGCGHGREIFLTRKSVQEEAFLSLFPSRLCKHLDGAGPKSASLRRYTGPLPDPADQAERDKTFVVLDQGAATLLLGVLRVLITQPSAALHTLFTAMRSGWEPGRGLFLRLAYFAEACFLYHSFAKEGVTHVHAHFGTNSTAVALLVRLLGGPRYSFTCHGPEEFDRTETLGLGAKIHNASFAIAISYFGRSQLYRWAATSDWEKIHVVHCGVDDAFLSMPLTPVPDSQQLLCIGRLSEQKGQLTLVEAAARVITRFPDFKLVLVGDGAMRPEIENAIRRLHLEKIVHLAGWKSGREIREILLSSRAMVLPSFAEGLPVVIMESLALGRPVISTSVMGIPELVLHGKTGWLVPPANPELLAEAIEECLDSTPVHLTEMGLTGRALVAERHTALCEAKKILQLISKDDA